MATVFVYGPDALQGRVYDKLGVSDVLGGARLEGYRLEFNKPNMKDKAEGLANLVEDENAEVFGVLYELSRKQVEMLEGYYGGYSPSDLRVVLLPRTEEEEERKLKAQVMVARRTGRDLKPSQANRDATVEGAEENGAPEAFIEAVKALETFDG